jgi:hypothetical protein
MPPVVDDWRGILPRGGGGWPRRRRCGGTARVLVGRCNGLRLRLPLSQRGRVGAADHRKATDNSGERRSADRAGQQAFSSVRPGRPITRIVSRTEEVRGSNPLTSTPQQRWSPAWREQPAGPVPSQIPLPGSKRAANGHETSPTARSRLRWRSQAGQVCPTFRSRVALHTSTRCNPGLFSIALNGIRGSKATKYATATANATTATGSPLLLARDRRTVASDGRGANVPQIISLVARYTRATSGSSSDARARPTPHLSGSHQ